MSTASRSSMAASVGSPLSGLREWSARAQLRQCLVVTGQLALLAVLADAFRLGSDALGTLLNLATVGFLIHALLPVRLRLPFFGVLSLTAIPIILGVRDGCCVIALGLILLGVCHLPCPVAVRRLLLIAVGAALLAVHMIGPPDWVGASVLPVLGSMFMFRMLIYQYDTLTGRQPTSLPRAVAYFFLLPNVVFPLFPVVDYRAFCATHYNDEHLRIYQKGVRWMLRGLIQLLLYRCVYQFLVLEPNQIGTGLDAFRFMTSTYLLYLQVSGSFHLIIGMLAIFGFNLPETHHLYFLSSSFTDFWRRINVYWKDFMVKLFFYPTYSRVKSLGPVRAMVLATVVTFVVTWALHSYQWLWLRGTFPLTLQDAVFWPVLAVLVIGNSLFEMKRGRSRSVAKSRVRGWAALSVAVRTIAVYCTICTLWCLWSCSSLAEFWFVLSSFTQTSLAEALVIALCLCGLGVAGVLFGHSTIEQTVSGRHAERQRDVFSFRPEALRVFVVAGAFCVAASPEVYERLPPQLASVVEQVRDPELNTADQERMTRGYYEDLTDVSRYNNELWQRYSSRPRKWERISDREDLVMPDPVLGLTLRPSVSGTLLDKPFTTNRFSLRDRDYSDLPAEGTYRIALVGNSNTMGRGVGDNETYESLAEATLNNGPLPEPWRRVEIMNFSASLRNMVTKVQLIERDVFRFKPHAVIYVTQASEPMFAAHYLLGVTQDGSRPVWERIEQLLREANVDASTPRATAMRRLQSSARGLTEYGWTRFGDSCRQHGVEPVLLYLPLPESRTPRYEETALQLVGLGRQLGFTIFDLRGALGDLPDEELILGPWDKHLNTTGHQRVARRLVERLREHLRNTDVDPADRLMKRGTQ